MDKEKIIMEIIKTTEDVNEIGKHAIHDFGSIEKYLSNTFQKLTDIVGTDEIHILHNIDNFMHDLYHEMKKEDKK